MTHRIEHCRFCDQPMRIPIDVQDHDVRCPHCQKVQGQRPSTQGDPATSTMNCPKCHQVFAFTVQMMGQVVACPFCKVQTIVPDRTTGHTPDVVGRPGARSATDSPKRPRFRTTSETDSEPTTTEKKVPPGQEIASEPELEQPLKEPTNPDASTKTSPSPVTEPAATSDSSTTSDVDEWLPPKFQSQTAGQIDSQTIGHKETSPIGIDPNLTRIHLADRKVTVRTLSREEKDRRRKMRVLIVFSASALLLIVVIFLLQLLW